MRPSSCLERLSRVRIRLLQGFVLLQCISFRISDSSSLRANTQNKTYTIAVVESPRTRGNKKTRPDYSVGPYRDLENCEPFENYIEVELTGSPEDVKRGELPVLESAFLESYEKLSQQACRSQGMPQIESVVIEGGYILLPSDEEDPTRINFAYKSRVRGQCCDCGSKVSILRDPEPAIGSDRLLLQEGQPGKHDVTDNNVRRAKKHGRYGKGGKARGKGKGGKGRGKGKGGKKGKGGWYKNYGKGKGSYRHNGGKGNGKGWHGNSRGHAKGKGNSGGTWMQLRNKSYRDSNKNHYSWSERKRTYQYDRTGGVNRAEDCSSGSGRFKTLRERLRSASRDGRGAGAPPKPTPRPTWKPRPKDTRTEPPPQSTPKPTPRPTQKPTRTPTQNPTERPTPEPTPRPTKTSRPTTTPTKPPTPEPTPRPTKTSKPTPWPTKQPTPEPTLRPTKTSRPTPRPTQSPTPEPTPDPTYEPPHPPTAMPTPLPKPDPTPDPTQWPTPQPSPVPTQTFKPTPGPTPEPSPRPTPSPTSEPSPRLTTRPTTPPTPRPSPPPSPRPTNRTRKPTPGPTTMPTFSPTLDPTQKPSPEPSLRPTRTSRPTPEPSPKPPPVPTLKPTESPTSEPTDPDRSSLGDVGAGSERECRTEVPTTTEFKNVFGDAISRHKELSLLDNIDGVTRVSNIEYAKPDCPEEADFETDIVVSHKGDPSAVRSSEIEALELAFVEMYNELNILNDDLCDTSFHVVNDVEIVVDGDTRERLEIKNRQRRDFKWRYKVRGRCRGCRRKAKLFDDTSTKAAKKTQRTKKKPKAARNLSWLSGGDRHLQDECTCPPDSVKRAPTEEEAIDSFNGYIEELVEDGILENVFSVGSISDVNEIDCSEKEKTFETQVYIGFKLYDHVNRKERPVLEEDFLQTYNSLAQKYCDENFRTVLSAQFSKLEETTRRRLWRQRVFRFTATWTCKGCGPNSKLFSEQGLPTEAIQGINLDDGTRLVEDDMCFCSVDPVAYRSPSKEEFLWFFSETILQGMDEGNLESVIEVLNITET